MRDPTDVRDDPWVMYVVVRKDLRLDLAAACPLAGGAVVACTREYEPRLPEAFAAWRERPRKIALRASAEELERLPEGWRDGDRLVCLPPRRRSDSGELLASLIPFTDARRPVEPTPPPDGPALTFAIAADLGMTTGKAMAQAGHAALMCADGPDGDRGPPAPAWRTWVEAGRPGRVVEAGADEFAAWAARPGAAVVRDAGLTQVAPGSETVACLPPVTL